MALWPVGHGSAVRVRYVVRGRGVGVRTVQLVRGGTAHDVPTVPLANPYRSAGVRVGWADLAGMADPHAELRVSVG